MIRGRRFFQGSSDFPFLDVAVMVLALYAILAVAFPDNPFRPIVALAAFFSMGYATLALIFGGSIRLSASEVLAFTVGLTILVTAGSALGVSVIGIPITQFAVIIIGLPVGVLTWLLRRPRISAATAFKTFVRNYFDLSDYSRAEKGIAAILFVAVLVALAGYVSLSALHYPDPPSYAIALTGPDGTPDSLNSTFLVGEARTMNVTILGDEAGGSFDLRIRLIPQNATGSEPFTPTDQAPPLHLGPFTEYREPLTIGPRGTWSMSYSIIMDARGLFWLRFELVDPTSSIVTWNHMPATVP
jgi:uncharacterized membrane protein